MGNYKFRLSDMIPNAWFYKLKYITRPRNNKTLINPTNNNNQITSTSSSSSSSSTAALSNNIPPSTITSQSQSSSSDQRKSYYFSRDLTNLNNSPTTKTTRISVSDKVEPPRKSSRRRRSIKRMIISRRHPPSHQLVSSSLSAGCSCRATLESVVWTKPPEDSTIEQNSSSEHESLLTEYGSDRGLTPDTTFDGMLSLAANSCKCRTHQNDVVSQVENERISDHLRPIITKKVQDPTKTRPKTSAELSERSAYGSLSVKLVKEEFLSSTTNNTVSPVRRSSSSPGVKLRTNSPRIANRRIQGRKSLQSPNSSSGSRRSVTAAAETFAVVKTSKDPRRDFRESMVEMIVENNLRASKDLEELLACYLSLNSDEYHDVIINVFKQIWFDFVHLRLKSGVNCKER